MKVYLHAMRLHLKSLVEYKASFVFGLISQVFVFFSYYFIILALFNKFDNIKGFTLYEVLLTFSARGIDQFDDLIIEGSFDQLLVRPQPIIIQVLCSKIAWIRISRTIQSIVVLIISLTNLNIIWNIEKIITLILMLVSSIIIFFALFLLMASYCFVTIKGLEVRNLFTDGGKHMAQYPIGIFKKGFIFIFTYIIPYAFVNYYPLLYFLGKSNNKLYMLSPLIVILYLIIPFYTFKKGIKKYTSTGS